MSLPSFLSSARLLSVYSFVPMSITCSPFLSQYVSNVCLFHLLLLLLLLLLGVKHQVTFFFFIFFFFFLLLLLLSPSSAFQNCPQTSSLMVLMNGLSAAVRPLWDPRSFLQARLPGTSAMSGLQIMLWGLWACLVCRAVGCV